MDEYLQSLKDQEVKSKENGRQMPELRRLFRFTVINGHYASPSSIEYPFIRFSNEHLR